MLRSFYKSNAARANVKRRGIARIKRTSFQHIEYFISITQLGPKFTTLKDFGSLNNNTVSGENKNGGFFLRIRGFFIRDLKG